MRKKISVEELRVGMYIDELDRPWRETPFLFQGLEVHSEDDIAQIKRHCQHVFIILPDVFSDPVPRQPLPDKLVTKAPFVAKRFDEGETMRRVSAPRFQSTYSDRTTIEEEVS